MDRVSILTAALADRQREHEQATGKVATCESDLAAAQTEFDSTNGDFAIWQAARDKLQFATRQLERAQAGLQQTEQNVQCATVALQTAQTEQRTKTLSEEYARNVKHTGDKATQAIDCYFDFIKLLADLDLLQEDSKRTVHQLGELGVRLGEVNVVNALLLELTTREPGMIALSFIQGPTNYFPQCYRDAINKGLVQTAVPLLAMSAPYNGSPTPVQQRAMLGCPEAQATLKAEQEKQRLADEQKRRDFASARATVPRLESKEEPLDVRFESPKMPDISSLPKSIRDNLSQ